MNINNYINGQTLIFPLSGNTGFHWKFQQVSSLPDQEKKKITRVSKEKSHVGVVEKWMEFWLNVTAMIPGRPPTPVRGGPHATSLIDDVTKIVSMWQPVLCETKRLAWPKLAIGNFLPSRQLRQLLTAICGAKNVLSMLQNMAFENCTL